MIKSGRKIKRKDDDLIKKINSAYSEDTMVPYRGNSSLPSSKSRFKYDKDRVDVIRKCAQNILYFAQHFFYIISLDEGKQKIDLHGYQRDSLRLLRDNRKVIINASRQVGKALSLDTPVPTPNGWTTMGDLKKGDKIYGSDGNEYSVEIAHKVMKDRPCYEIRFSNGETIISDEEHDWMVCINDEKEEKQNTLNMFFALESGKKIKIKDKRKKDDVYFHIKSIEPVSSRPVRCITVNSPDNLYLVGKSYIPTHNTTISTIYALWLVTFFDYKRIVIVANKEKTAQEIFNRIRLAYEELPNWLKPAPEDYAKTGMKLMNGSEITISATSSDAIRGMSANCILLDEAAHIDANILDAFWSSVYPVISSGKKTRVILTSTPNGVGNLFHKIFSKSKDGEYDWAFQEIHWYDVPGRDEAWEKEQRDALGDEMFEQEFNCKFLESGQSLIPEEIYNRLLQYVCEPKFTFDNDQLKVWEAPDISEKIYTAGMDIGEGVGACASVLQIVDITDLSDVKLVAQYHNNDDHPTVFAKKCNQILKAWGNPPLAIERNNTGGGMILQSFEQDFRYQNLVTFAMKQGNKKGNHIRGVTSATNTKYAGVQNMFYWLKQTNALKIFDINTLKELRTFIRHKNNRYGRRDTTVYDDRVDAFMWALIPLHENVIEDFFAIEMKDENNKPLLITPLYRREVDKNNPYDYMFPTNSNVPDGIWGVGENVNSEIEVLESEGWMNPNAFSKTKSYQSQNEYLLARQQIDDQDIGFIGAY